MQRSALRVAGPLAFWGVDRAGLPDYHDVMKRLHERKPSRVSEPVQVYLAGPERARLARLVKQLDTTKSDVIRQGLEALEVRLSDPADHPVLRIMELANGATVEPAPYDVAREHDRFLAESEADSWAKPAKPARGPKKRGR
jgi:hypothetical protein